MDHKLQKLRAADFLAMHHMSAPLILPNAWDVASAKIFELAGHKAVGTTSAGIGATLGYPDGECMSLAETLAVTKRIIKHIDVPVSIDLETGYATSIEGVVNSARAALEIGAVGINLEDGTGDLNKPLFSITLQQEKINAIRAMADTENIPLVINARTDVYLVDDEPPTTQLERAVERAKAYHAAGADCIFIPDLGTLDTPTITSLVAAIDVPINIIAGHNTPSITELAKLGIARISFGPRPMRAALTLVRQFAEELLTMGTYDQMLSATITYNEVNQWFSRD